MKNIFFLPKYYERKKLEKRGLGEGADYKPYLEVYEVPSRGRSLRAKGWKTGRIHHMFSDLESNFFFKLEWDSDVTDIREQFPLDFMVTLQIARELKIIHPRNTKTKELHIMTTDFVVNVGNEVIAYACKYKKESQQPRTIQKLQLERAYWEKQGIKFEIITEDDIPVILVRNVRSIHHARDLAGVVSLPSLEDRQYIEKFFEYSLRRKRTPLAIANQIDKEFNMSVGSAMLLFRSFIANKKIKIDMNNKLNVTKPLMLKEGVYVSD